jgi:hypothetical protein
MKKTIKLIGTILLVFALVFTLTACGNGTTSSNDKDKDKDKDKTVTQSDYYGTWKNTTGSIMGTNNGPYELTLSAGQFYLVDNNGDFRKLTSLVWTPASYPATTNQPNIDAGYPTDYPTGYILSGTHTYQGSYNSPTAYVALHKSNRNKMLINLLPTNSLGMQLIFDKKKKKKRWRYQNSWM